MESNEMNERNKRNETKRDGMDWLELEWEYLRRKLGGRGHYVL